MGGLDKDVSLKNNQPLSSLSASLVCHPPITSTIPFHCMAIADTGASGHNFMPTRPTSSSTELPQLFQSALQLVSANTHWLPLSTSAISCQPSPTIFSASVLSVTQSDCHLHAILGYHPPQGWHYHPARPTRRTRLMDMAHQPLRPRQPCLPSRTQILQTQPCGWPSN